MPPDERLTALEQSLWRPYRRPPQLDRLLIRQREENDRLIEFSAELDRQEHRLNHLHQQTGDFLQSRLWQSLCRLARLGLRRPTPPPPAPVTPPPAGPYERWQAQHETPVFAALPTSREITLSVVSWSPSNPLSRQTLAPDTVEFAAAPAEFEQALQRPIDGLVVLCGGNGQLSPHALATLQHAALTHPDADLFYADEDSLDSQGRRHSPFFKPDWSPDLFAHLDYLTGVIACTPALARTVQSPATLADAVHQLTQRARHIVHIPAVLFHHAADRAAAVRHPSYPPPPANAKVSIVIPTAGKMAVLERCLGSLRQWHNQTDFDILLIDNSTTEDVRQFAAAQPKLQCADFRHQPFNYAQLHNDALRDCPADYLLLLNDDTEALHDGWLDAMLTHAARPEVGAVGALLLYPDRRIQHAGIVISLFDNCGHAFRTLPGDGPPHYFGLSHTVRNVSAVTAACLLMRSDVFWEVGGFDARAFPVAYNDVDLCLRLGRAGYRILYTPHAKLLHHEAHSKPDALYKATEAETQAFQTRWADLIRQDPYYSPNLTRWREDYALPAD